MEDTDKLAQMRANFKVLTGIAELAQQHITAGHEHIGFSLLENLTTFSDACYYCEIDSVVDPDIKIKALKLVGSDMHLDYLAFLTSVKYLIARSRGAGVVMSPSPEDVLKARGFVLDSALPEKEQAKSVLTWFVNGAAAEFNENQELFT